MKIVTDAQGKKFIRVRKATKPDKKGISFRAVWHTVPPDGREYFADLAYDTGLSKVPSFYAFK